ncbi:hypothetical protein NEIG_00473 [Nematocida sp. ERTm5]|nr:hypothetical protein NEIG_00473 [Nematocida sp. ERTm5]
MRITVRPTILLLLIISAALVKPNPALNPDDILPNHTHKPPIENVDSFLQVFEKLMHNFPSFKSKVFLRLHKFIDPDSPDATSNPATYFRLNANNIPEPDEVVKKFQSIQDATNMIKQDTRTLIAQIQRSVDQMFLNEKEILRTIDGLMSDANEIIDQYQSESDPLIQASLVVKFKAKEKQLIKSIKAIGRIRNWERKINKRLAASRLSRKILRIK